MNEGLEFETVLQEVLDSARSPIHDLLENVGLPDHSRPAIPGQWLSVAWGEAAARLLLRRRDQSELRCAVLGRPVTPAP